MQPIHTCLKDQKFDGTVRNVDPQGDSFANLLNFGGYRNRKNSGAENDFLGKTPNVRLDAVVRFFSGEMMLVLLMNGF